MSAATKHLRSLSQLCSDYGVPFARVMRAIEELKIAPTMTLNSTPYYGDAEAEKIHAELKRTTPQAPSMEMNSRIERRGR